MPVPLFVFLQKAHLKKQYSEYWRIGQLCAIQVNTNLKKGSKGKSPEDFIPKYIADAYKGITTEVKKADTADEMKAKARAFTAQLGGRFVSKQKPQKRAKEK